MRASVVWVSRALFLSDPRVFKTPTQILSVSIVCRRRPFKPLAPNSKGKVSIERWKSEFKRQRPNRRQFDLIDLFTFESRSWRSTWHCLSFSLVLVAIVGALRLLSLHNPWTRPNASDPLTVVDLIFGIVKNSLKFQIGVCWITVIDNTNHERTWKRWVERLDELDTIQITAEQARWTHAKLF